MARHVVARRRSPLSAAALGIALALGAAPLGAQNRPATPSERARMQAEYERELTRMREAHQMKLVETRTVAAAVEKKMAVLRRLVPLKCDAGAMAEKLQALALRREMPPLEITRVAGSERIRLADGRPTPYERHFLDIAGQARYMSVGIFFDGVGRGVPLVELQTLSLDARPDGSARFAARLAFPCHSGWPEGTTPAPAVPPGSLGSYATVAEEKDARLRSLLEHTRFLAREAEVAYLPVWNFQQEVDAIGELTARGAPARFIAALARATNELDESGVALSRARFGAQSSVEGTVMGATARAALRPAFEKAGFEVDALEVAPSGECRAFTVTAHLKPAPQTDDGRGPVDLGRWNPFRDSTAGSCAAPPPHRGTATARGSRGDVTLHVRDADVGDVFNVLATLWQGHYVLDGDVTGRVNVDFERATLDEALAAMRIVGLTVGEGLLRRVSLAGARRPAPPRAASREQPITLVLKDGRLVDVLRLFQDISGRTAWTPPVLDGRVTLYATVVPWDTALEAIATSAGMVLVVEDDRFFVGPAAMAKTPWASGAVELSRARTTDTSKVVKTRGLAGLDPEDLSPVGFARTADGVKGLAHGPGRLLIILEPGAELYAARVEAVDATGVTFADKDGRKTAMRLQPTPASK